MGQPETISGVAAGVPYVALPPAGGGSAPLLAVWHLMDPPRSESAMAAALPMTGVRAWRVYLGLPLSGERAPAGGFAELVRLAGEDAVLNVFGPVTEQAAAELPGAVAALRERLPIAAGPIGVAGGSAGSLVALEVIARGDVAVAAGAVVSPVCRLAPLIELNARQFGVRYAWTGESRAVAARHDYVARAEEIRVPLLAVVGERDDPEVAEPAAELVRRLGPRGELVAVEDMGHALAAEPGTEPAPQTDHARQVDAAFTGWLARRLTG